MNIQQWSCFAITLLLRNSVLLHGRKVTGCAFEGIGYKEGETWLFDANGCTTCTCGKDGKVTCHSQDCPQLSCDHQQILPGQCCTTCLDNIPPLVVEETIITPPSRPCMHADLLRHHGEVFPSTSSGLRPTSPNQCVLCYCIDTDVLCHLKSCPVATCRFPVHRDNDCCRYCPADDDDKEEKPMVGDIVEIKMISSTQPPKPTNQHLIIPHNPDCHFGGKVYRNSSVWHPVVATFGKMNCVLCQCVDSEITCARVMCTAEDELPCPSPIMNPGDCCKSCPSEQNSTAESEAEISSRNVKSGEDKREGESINSVLPSELCVGRNVDVVLYVFQRRNTYSLLAYLIQKRRMEEHTWKLDSGQIVDYRKREVEEDSVRQFQNYKLLGGTRTRRWSRLKSRMKRLMEKCQPSCSKRLIHRLVRRLRIKTIKSRDTC